MKHELWLWVALYIGIGMFWLKRADFGIQEPNRVATGYVNWLQRSWAPLLVRIFIDSAIFGLLFTPGIADKALAQLGWENYSWAVSMITQFTFVAALFGYVLDSIVDYAVVRVPFLKNLLAQMPGPLPQKAIVQSAIVEQTTKVTALESKTTILNPQEGK